MDGFHGAFSFDRKEKAPGTEARPAPRRPTQPQFAETTTRPRVERRPPKSRYRHAMAFDSAALLRWYARVRRPLPWRATRDPYALLVSEVMLQQTQAARVVPYYEAFLRRFPDPAALAAAPVRDVLA